MFPNPCFSPYCLSNSFQLPTKPSLSSILNFTTCLERFSVKIKIKNKFLAAKRRLVFHYILSRATSSHFIDPFYYKLFQSSLAQNFQKAYFPPVVNFPVYKSILNRKTSLHGALFYFLQHTQSSFLPKLK
jgi:hypothetical protein